MNSCLHLNKFLATGIGSLPHNNPQEACALVFKYLGDQIPFWPQLPKRGFKENMYVQYSQGLPGVVLDEDSGRIYIDTTDKNYSSVLELAYNEYLTAKIEALELEYFKISPDYASGFYEFLNSQEAEHKDIKYVKGQTIGPVSFGLSVCDQDKKAIIYNEEFRDCLVKVLTMKAIWQVRKLKSSYLHSEVIIFIDEPYLVSLGSSYFNIGAELITAMLNEIIDALHEQGVYVGIHCCGNTDWPVLLGSNLDILSFDSYGYSDTLFLYRNAVDNFKKRGGCLAWGIVPTAADEKLPSLERLIKKIGKQEGYSLITPACGLSGVSIEKAQEILALTAKISEVLLPL